MTTNKNVDARIAAALTQQEEVDALRKALSDMLAHMFGPDDTGLSRPEIEAQARAALRLGPLAARPRSHDGRGEYVSDGTAG